MKAIEQYFPVVLFVFGQSPTFFSFFFSYTVGEPINAEAWHWYNEVVGEKRCVIVDTWWQTGKTITGMCSSLKIL